MAAKNSGAPEVVGSIPATGMSKKVSSGYIWGFPLDMKDAPPRPPGVSQGAWAKKWGRFPNDGEHPAGQGCSTPKKKLRTLQEEADARRKRMMDD